MKKQIFLVHGGDTFRTYEDSLEYLKNRQIDFEKHGLRKKDWQDNLADRLGEEFEVIRPEMPNKRNAKYLEWKIWFEKFLPYVHDDIVLIGGSMGGIFLAKYLSENDFPKKIKALFLIAAPFQDKDRDYELLDFSLPQDLSKLLLQPGKIFLYHSKDDNVVPFGELSFYQRALPDATVRVFEDYQHFNQAEFPILIEDIKNL